MTRTRYALFALLSICIALVLFLLAAELVLRLLPVNEGMRAFAVTAAQPVFHFESDRKAVFAKGPLFQIVNRVRTNNAGFVSDQPYVVDDPRPLLAIIGDSYVEALMVPYGETLQARLAAGLGDKGRAYAFAASGAGLSQYLAWARFARDTYHPQAMTIVIIPNDFSESLANRERSPGFHAFARRPDGSAEMVLTEYRPSLLRRVLRNSALFMYLVTQAKVHTLLDVPLTLGADDTRWVGNVASQASEDYLADSRWASDRFLDMLPEYAGLPRDRIQLVVETTRPNIYHQETMEEGRNSYWGLMRAYVLEQARARGHDVIDLNGPFMAAYARDHRRFEFPTDGHWNGEGHRVAAEAVQASPMFKRVFPAAAN